MHPTKALLSAGPIRTIQPVPSRVKRRSFLTRLLWTRSPSESHWKRHPVLNITFTDSGGQKRLAEITRVNVHKQLAFPY